MKKTSICIAVLMLLSIFSIQAQGLLPITVQQFLDEQGQNKPTLTTHSESAHRSSFAPVRNINGTDMIEAFVAVDNENTIAMLEGMGVIINSKFDGFVTAQIPVNGLESICRFPGVNDVEIGQLVEQCTDSTLRVTHTYMVNDGYNYDLPYGYDGSGVIVGIIDNGFDFQHRAFRRSDDPSVTRIARIYNTHDSNGHPAVYGTGPGNKLPGSVFMDEQIYDLTTDESGTHGTHTASIAAGTHVNGYGGMAPGADIVLCAVSELSGSLVTTEIANCLQYLKLYADSVGKPLVMSMSVSTTIGQHDGQDYLSKAIEQKTGPGRIFVIAAGNNGSRPGYTYKVASKESPINVLFQTYSSSAVDSAYFISGSADFWVRETMKKPFFKFHIIDLKTGSIVWESQECNATTRIYSSEFSDYFDGDPNVDTTSYVHAYYIYQSYGKKYEVRANAHNLKNKAYTIVNGVKRGRYGLGISIYPQTAEQFTVDAWVGSSSGRFAPYDKDVKTLDDQIVSNFYSEGTDQCSIGTYACNDSIISAGAYAARNSYYSLKQGKTIVDNAITVGNIADFSSYQAHGYGPTGESLPTVCAPGITVVAAGSRYSYFNNNHNHTVMKTDDGSIWGVMSGTSMAAPTVAGIIALWLQANPDLGPSDIKTVIAKTANRDTYTLARTGYRFGPNGKIDAYKGMGFVLSQMAVEPGDVNQDGDVNIVDVTDLINYLLGRPDGGFVERAADVNGDGTIDINDLTQLISNILLS